MKKEWFAMRRGLLAGLAAAAVFVANSAGAADLSAPVYKSPPVQPTLSWTGCYIGGVAGGVANYSNFTAGTLGAGALAGGDLGCNYQIYSFVVGIEGEGLWSGAVVNANAGVPGAIVDNSTKNRWDADVAVRAGFAWDRFFIYNKVGIAWADFSFASNGAGFSSTGSTTIPGFIEGIGAEYMIDPHWSAKLEFDLQFFNASNVTLSCTGACVATVASPSELQILGKLGVNYRF